jgi:hypothetical protein
MLRGGLEYLNKVEVCSYNHLCNRCRFPVVYPVIWEFAGASQAANLTIIRCISVSTRTRQAIALAIGIRTGLCKQNSKSEVEERASIGSRPAGYQPPS